MSWWLNCEIMLLKKKGKKKVVQEFGSFQHVKSDLLTGEPIGV